jgi:hypothetical protein
MFREYLNREEVSNTWKEYYGGEVYAMVESVSEHAALSAAVTSAFGTVRRGITLTPIPQRKRPTGLCSETEPFVGRLVRHATLTYSDHLPLPRVSLPSHAGIDSGTLLQSMGLPRVQVADAEAPAAVLQQLFDDRCLCFGAREQCAVACRAIDEALQT